MRIAITGTHGTGKTTLAEALSALWPHYEYVAEPYWLLAQQGTPFADGPTVADLEEQLAQSCSLILGSAAQQDVVFDRCPLDFIAYLDIVSAQEGYEWSPHGRLLVRIEGALATLDRIVFLPVTRPDEIDVPIEYPKLRARVDARLKVMLRDDDLGLLDGHSQVLELSGTREQRLARLMVAIDPGAAR